MKENDYIKKIDEQGNSNKCLNDKDYFKSTKKVRNIIRNERK